MQASPYAAFAATQPLSIARQFDDVEGPRADETSFHFSAMACACEVRLIGPAPAEAQRLANLAVAEVRRIERTYSRYRPGSVVSRINAAAGSGQPVAVDGEADCLLAFAAQLHAASDGLFDITSGVLRKAWNFPAARLPAPGQLEALLPLVGWQQVQWQDRKVLLPLAGMELDFGGIGKEFAADRAATLLQELGLDSGMVKLGNDVRLLGPRPGKQPWSLAVAHPRHLGAVLARRDLRQGALATSGDYERYFELQGQRFCDVLDPRSGQPVSDWQSVSVVAATCLTAGALTTVAMLKGDAALAFLDSQHVDYLAVDARGRAHSSRLSRDGLAFEPA